MEPIVRYELSGGVATITMDDGKANVVSVRMQQELTAAFDRAAADKAAVVLAGRGRIFSGGFDLAVFKGERGELLRMLEGGARLAEKIVSHPRPVVAACTGHAVAMGVFLLLAADVRVGVAEGARVHVNEVQIGIPVPNFAVEICRHRVTAPWFQTAVSTGEPCAPQQAVAAGFLGETVPAEAVLATARTRAEALAKLNPAAFGETKLRVTRPLREALPVAIAQDVEEWKRMFS